MGLRVNFFRKLGFTFSYPEISAVIWYQLIPKLLTAPSSGVIVMTDQTSEQKRIESKLEVQTYLDRLKCASLAEST